jgi:hypothetical protein
MNYLKHVRHVLGLLCLRAATDFFDENCNI